MALKHYLVTYVMESGHGDAEASIEIPMAYDPKSSKGSWYLDDLVHTLAILQGFFDGKVETVEEMIPLTI